LNFPKSPFLGSHLSNLFVDAENSAPLLRVDKQSGELLATGKFPKNNNYSSINICILARLLN